MSISKAIAPLSHASPPTIDPKERQSSGKELRQQVPRSLHAEWRPPPDRTDPIALLRASNRGRLPSLVPIRIGRMIESLDAFVRGSVVIMAHDLNETPSLGQRIQICGDAHLGNFGGFATPERRVIFDLNDFDETAIGPWEWDVKRLAVSTVISARQNGLSDATARDVAQTAAASYRLQMRAFSDMRYLQIWSIAIDADELLAQLREPGVVKKMESESLRKTNAGARSHLAEAVDQGLKFANDPPLLTHRTYPIRQRLPDVWARYRSSLPVDRRLLLDRYRIVDVARKVVGVGSVGLRCHVLLLLGNDDADPLVLQLKEARPSVYAPFAGRSPYRNEGKRVACGQRIMQSATDLLLGWTRCGPIDYYVRQFRDRKFGVPVDHLNQADLLTYARFCAQTLARAHACSGDPAQIGGYLGAGDGFDRAISEFAVAYADQVERDFDALRGAVKAGRLAAERGV